MTSALIEAALEVAREREAAAIEAYPLDARLTPSASHTGYASTFARPGFTKVGQHVRGRPIMRYELNNSD